MESELHTMSIGQTAHKDLLKKSGLRRIFFAFKIWPAAHDFHEKSSS